MRRTLSRLLLLAPRRSKALGWRPSIAKFINQATWRGFIAQFRNDASLRSIGTVSFGVITALLASAGWSSQVIAQNWNGPVEDEWAKYQTLTPNKAFAVTLEGTRAFSWQAGDGFDPQPQIKVTLDDCEARAKSKCALYAVNNIVVAGKEWKALKPKQLANIDRLRPQPWWQNRGPKEAAGLLIWSHGYDGTDSTATSAPQSWAGEWLAAGYDLYRFDRDYIVDWPGDATSLVKSVKHARDLGYRRIILAGQSAGAWVSMAAAARGAEVDGVVATAAAHHGILTMSKADPTVAQFEWSQIVGDIRAGPRIVVVNFAKDPYDAGRKIEEAKSAFSKNHVDAVMISEPLGFEGHHGAFGWKFHQAFGDCIFQFVESAKRVPPCR